MAAALAGQADRAVSLLNDHFTRTAELCRDLLRRGASGGGPAKEPLQ